ncbi:MAG: VPLPA-CTERM sorting domain-containing protein [Methylococcaceae bacterium]|nr:VPLPA-CTERM sorting domain-containing protein [Methylococcaceae bacterium]
MQERNNSFYHLGAVALLAVLPNLGHAATAVPNFDIDGIPKPGFPHFANSADITLTKSDSGSGASFQLSAVSTDKSPFVFQYNPSSSFTVNGTFNLAATFNASGKFTDGNITVDGTIPGYNVPGTTAPSSTNLFSAKLIAFGAETEIDDSSPVALGFKTDNLTGWAGDQFGNHGQESVYLYNFNVPGLMNDFSNFKFKTATFHGSAITTVPVPAAVWLFGSALALLSGARRRKAALV